MFTLFMAGYIAGVVTIPAIVSIIAFLDIRRARLAREREER